MREQEAHSYRNSSLPSSYVSLPPIRTKPHDRTGIILLSWGLYVEDRHKKSSALSWSLEIIRITAHADSQGERIFVPGVRLVSSESPTFALFLNVYYLHNLSLTRLTWQK